MYFKDPVKWSEILSGHARLWNFRDPGEVVLVILGMENSMVVMVICELKSIS